MRDSPAGRRGHWNKHGEWRDDRYFARLPGWKAVREGSGQE